MEETPNYLKNLDRFNQEFGNTVTYISMVCIECLQVKEERRAVAIRLPFTYNEVEYEYLAFPLCLDCPGDLKKVYDHSIDFIESDHIMAIIV